MAARRLVGSVAVATGVQFDKGCADLLCHRQLFWVGIDKDRYRDRGLGHFFDDLGNFLFLRDDVQPAFGGQFLPFFRDQGDEVRLDVQGDRDNLLVGTHLQVHFRFDGLAQQDDIPVLDMAAVFTQVDDDARGSGQFADRGGGDRIRLVDASGLSDGGNMIDVDGESGHCCSPVLFIFGQQVIFLGEHFFLSSV